MNKPTTHHADWFPVERSEHVARGAVVPSMLQGQEIALWRADDGRLQAWENRCPHRSVRLSLGFVAGDQLVCRYHGWRYGADGRCTGVPSTPALAPPPAACVRSYACRESAGVVWVSLAQLPAGYPPALAELEACRSFTVDASFEATMARLSRRGFAAERPSVWREHAADDGRGAVLLLQPMEAATTVVHLFIEPCTDGSTRADKLARRTAAIARIKPLLEPSMERLHA
ncbi:Rieske (2Fe-2S) protein [Pelomonas sp. KK5]|uniref:Rieske (2Fe-2S) protein n=1 Tax=Pelomonas sp. KK5 TaxID=1855730 RepID=UPI00097C6A23|nr:Rieske (2Fe-2S) protein [Pelomonas sp. KK5]